MYAYYINIQKKANIISIRKMHFTFCTRFSKIQNKGKIIYIFQILIFSLFSHQIFLFEFLLLNCVNQKFDIIESFTTFSLLRLCSIVFCCFSINIFSPKGPQISEGNKRWKSQCLVSLRKSMTGRQVNHPVHCGRFSNIPEPFP